MLSDMYIWHLDYEIITQLYKYVKRIPRHNMRMDKLMHNIKIATVGLSRPVWFLPNNEKYHITSCSEGLVSITLHHIVCAHKNMAWPVIIITQYSVLEGTVQCILLYSVHCCRPPKCLNHHNQRLCKFILDGVNFLLQTYGVLL